jgi:hypothetical protein
MRANASLHGVPFEPHFSPHSSFSFASPVSKSNILDECFCTVFAVNMASFGKSNSCEWRACVRAWWAEEVAGVWVCGWTSVCGRKCDVVSHKRIQSLAR